MTAEYLEWERARRRRRRFVLAGAGGAVVLLVASLAVVRVVNYSPESAARSTVNAFFEALADGDLEGLLAIAAPEAVDEAVEQLGGDPIQVGGLIGNVYQAPRGARIEKLTVDGDSAVAEVTYFAGTGRHPASLRLRRDTGFVDTVVSPRWRVLDAFGTLDLGEVHEEVLVDRLPVPDPGPDGRLRMPVLPGSHEVMVVNELLSFDPVNVVTAPGATTEAEVPLEPSDAARFEVEHAVRESIQDCPRGYPVYCAFPLTVVEPAGSAFWSPARSLEFDLIPETDDSGMVTTLRVETTTTGVMGVQGFHAPSGIPQQFRVRFVYSWGGEVNVSGGDISYDAEWTFREELAGGSD